MNTKLMLCAAAFLATIAARAQNAGNAQNAGSARTILQVPATAEWCHIDPSGATVLPSGRLVTPAGETVRITRSAFSIALSPDGKTALVLHNGVISLIPTQSIQQVTRIPSYDHSIPAVMKGAAFLGAAISPDSKLAYLSGGDRGNVVILDLATRQRVGEISLNGDGYQDSFTSDLLIDSSRSELLVLDRANFRMVRIDLTTQKIKSSVKVGRIPFGIALSPDKKTALVANVGLYAYPLVPGVTPRNKDSMMLDFPPYGVVTKESEEGTEVKGRKIPGLGSPHVPDAMSVFTIDLDADTVMDRFKTGFQIGQMVEGAEIVGGASPNSIAVGSRYAYVSNATDDIVSVIDYKEHKMLGDIALKIDPALDHYRGLMPFGLCLSKDESTLYVALLGLNAVAVVDTKTGETRGLIPTGWGTTRVVLSDDQQYLYITSARGYGAGPNGGKGFVKPPQGTYIGDIQLSTFQKVKVPDGQTLKTYTAQVLSNTYKKVEVADDGKNPLPPLPGLRQSPIKYIVYITKENRTYDEVMGQLDNAKGDSTIARFGIHVPVTLAYSKTVAVQDALVMPNHLRLAKAFAFGDNFYCDSDASIHGHHWMVGTIPNEYVEVNSAEGGSFNAFSNAPGRRFPGSTGGMDPEDYNEIGGLWENMERHHVPFYNFGEANEYTGVWEEWNETKFGSMQPVVFPLPKALYDRTSRTYAGFNTNIPDQLRVDQFEREYTLRWLQGKETLPRLLVMQLPNDHGAGPRPKDGYPYLQSYEADNDLALGRIIQFLSHTPYWKQMLVIVTEDDAQGGVDHIDAHRSDLILIGPYVRHGYVSHTHANFGSLLKVIYNLTGAGYVNQYDLTASLLSDCFTDTPDYTPYMAVPSDTRVFDPQKALDRYHRNFDWTKVHQGALLDDEDDQREEFYKGHK